MANIVVADDAGAVRTFITRCLEQVGHHVLEAHDGHEVLSIIESTNIDAIILDILMPKKEGLETLMELRQDRKSLPVITISSGDGNPHSDYLDISVKLGATDSIRKPFAAKELLAVLEKTLRADERVPNSA